MFPIASIFTFHVIQLLSPIYNLYLSERLVEAKIWSLIGIVKVSLNCKKRIHFSNFVLTVS